MKGYSFTQRAVALGSLSTRAAQLNGVNGAHMQIAEMQTAGAWMSKASLLCKLVTPFWIVGCNYGGLLTVEHGCSSFFSSAIRNKKKTLTEKVAVF